MSDALWSISKLELALAVTPRVYHVLTSKKAERERRRGSLRIWSLRTGLQPLNERVGLLLFEIKAKSVTS